MLGLVVADIDGTLLHRDISEGEYLQTPGKPRYLTRAAYDCLDSLSVPFGLITGNAWEKASQRASIIPHAFLSLEHGCLLYFATSVGYDEDREWNVPLLQFAGSALRDFETTLHHDGLQIAWEGREVSFKVHCGRLNDVSVDEMGNIRDRYRAYHEIAFHSNKGKLYAYPAQGGKGNVLRHLADCYHVSLDDVAALGDDDNDAPLLEIAGHPLFMRGPFPALEELVRTRGGCASLSSSHQGTLDLLQEVVRRSSIH